MTEDKIREFQRRVDMYRTQSSHLTDAQISDCLLMALELMMNINKKFEELLTPEEIDSVDRSQPKIELYKDNT